MSKFKVFLGVAAVIVFGLVLVAVGIAGGHSIWTENSLDYAAELQAQAVLSQARAGELNGWANLASSSALPIAASGTLLIGIGWLSILVGVSLALIRSTFAISRVIEVRGGYVVVEEKQHGDTILINPPAKKRIVALPLDRSDPGVPKFSVAGSNQPVVSNVDAVKPESESSGTTRRTARPYRGRNAVVSNAGAIV